MQKYKILNGESLQRHQVAFILSLYFLYAFIQYEAAF